MFLNFIKYKKNIGMHIFQHYDIITKNRSLLAYDGHSALLKFLITIQYKTIKTWCPCVRVYVCLSVCACVCAKE